MPRRRSKTVAATTRRGPDNAVGGPSDNLVAGSGRTETVTACRRSRSQPWPGNNSTGRPLLAAATPPPRSTAATRRCYAKTVIGLSQGARLAEHENPGAATIQVLHGRVRMIVGGQSWEARTGDLLIVPDARHSLEALQDSAVLLTVAKLS